MDAGLTVILLCQAMISLVLGLNELRAGFALKELIRYAVKNTLLVLSMGAIALSNNLIVVGSAWVLTATLFLETNQKGVEEGKGFRIGAFNFVQCLSSALMVLAFLTFFTVEVLHLRSPAISFTSYASFVEKPGFGSVVASVLTIIAIMMRQATFPLHFGAWEIYHQGKLARLLPFFTSQTGVLLLSRLSPALAPVGYPLISNMLILFFALLSLYFILLSVIQVQVRGVLFYYYLSLMHLIFMILVMEGLEDEGLMYYVMASLQLSFLALGFLTQLVEERTGIKSVVGYSGLAEVMPVLSGFFLFFSLCAANFPWSIGFVAEDLLIHHLMSDHFLAFILVVITFSFFGISLLRLYVRLFMGPLRINFTRRDLRVQEYWLISIIFVLLLALSSFPHLINNKAQSLITKGQSHYHLNESNRRLE